MCWLAQSLKIAELSAGQIKWLLIDLDMLHSRAITPTAQLYFYLTNCIRFTFAIIMRVLSMTHALNWLTRCATSIFRWKSVAVNSMFVGCLEIITLSWVDLGRSPPTPFPSSNYRSSLLLAYGFYSWSIESSTELLFFHQSLFSLKFTHFFLYVVIVDALPRARAITNNKRARERWENHGARSVCASEGKKREL